MKPLHSAADEEAAAAAAAEKRPKFINVTGADGSLIDETRGPREPLHECSLEGCDDPAVKAKAAYETAAATTAAISAALSKRMSTVGRADGQPPDASTNHLMHQRREVTK